MARFSPEGRVSARGPRAITEPTEKLAELGECAAAVGLIDPSAQHVREVLELLSGAERVRLEPGHLAGGRRRAIPGPAADHTTIAARYSHRRLTRVAAVAGRLRVTPRA